MTSFKVKNKIKKKDGNTRVTLDALHNKQMDLFDKEDKELKTLEMEYLVLKHKFGKLDNKSMKSLDSNEIETKLTLKETIEELETKINTIKYNSQKTDYFLENGSLLFQYYSISDKSTVNKYKTKNKNTKSVMEYFKSKAEFNDSEVTEVSTLSTYTCNNSNKYLSKASIYDQYMTNTDAGFVMKPDDTSIDICPDCNTEKTLYISNGKLICNQCGDETTILIDSDKPSYKDPPREVSYFAYKRINHFNEWLAQFQAKESTDIPKDVYDSIIIELKKERIINMEYITPKKIREILKKLKKNKYYEHIPHIINKLNGIPPPVMSRETEEELRRMFKEIQVPFHNFCPPNRKNFLSYSYVLHKFVQLLELDEFLKCFILLKSREKLHQQDQIWRHICEYLKWQFIPSI